MKKIFDLFWILSSFSLALFFFIITMKSDEYFLLCTLKFNNFKFDFGYVLVFILFVSPLFFLKIYKKFKSCNETITIESIKPAEIDYVPVYIGYIIIATGITSKIAFLIIMFVISLLIQFTRIYYFNPTLLIIGYRFYEVTDKNGVSILLISKEKDIKTKEQRFNLYRFNNYVFLEEREK